MGNAGVTSKENTLPEENSEGDKDSPERRLNVVGNAIGTISAVAGFVFEILQYSSPLERVLSSFLAIALGGVIAEAIKAWPVIRRYKFMLTCAVVTFISLGTLLVVVPPAGTQQPESGAGGGAHYPPNSIFRSPSIGATSTQVPSFASCSLTVPSGGKIPLDPSCVHSKNYLLYRNGYIYAPSGGTFSLADATISDKLSSCEKGTALSVGKVNEGIHGAGTTFCYNNGRGEIALVGPVDRPSRDTISFPMTIWKVLLQHNPGP